MVEPEYLTTREAAVRLQVSTERIKQLRLLGRLTAVSAGDRWLFLAASVEQYQAERAAYLTPEGRSAAAQRAVETRLANLDRFKFGYLTSPNRQTGTEGGA